MSAHIIYYMYRVSHIFEIVSFFLHIRPWVIMDMNGLLIKGSE
jgi:hypothetical protein